MYKRVGTPIAFTTRRRRRLSK